MQRSELVTKAKELMTSENLDYATAAKKARELTTTPTVQNLPVEPTGGANIPIAPQVQQPPQTQVVNGETFQVAPVNPQTGLSTPAPAPTPAPTTTQTTTPAPSPATTPASTPSPPPDADIKAKNEAQMALNKQQADLRDQERQKIAQETAQATMPKSASEMYNLIASKQTVPLEVQNTSAYRVANNRYQRVNQFSNMTPTEINQAFTSGRLVEGSQTFEDFKALNPKLAQDAINLRKVNGNKTNIFTVDSSGNKVNNLERKFAEEYEEDHPDIIEQLKSVFGTPSYEEMQAKINTPEVKRFQEKATSVELEMNNLLTAMEAVDKEVDAELAGSGATISRKALEKTTRKKELQKEYDAKLRDYTTYYNKATNLINQNTEMFKYAQEQKKAMQTALADVYMAQYQNQLAQQNTAQAQKFQMGMAQFQNALQQGNASFQTIGDKVYKTQNGQMTDTGIKAEPNTTYQAVGGKLYKIKGDQITDTGISAIEPTKPTAPYELKELGGKTYKFNQATGQYEVISGGGATGVLPSSFTGDTTSYIASKEGFRDTAYQDSAGVWTIGYGTTKINGKPVQPGQKITQEEAQKLLNEDIARHSNWKNYIDENTLSPSQRTALASFEYNLGPGIWEKSAMNIINMVKSGDLAGASAEMQKYVNAGGKRVQGLANRRAEEAQLLMNAQGNNAPGTQYTQNKIELLAEISGIQSETEKRKALEAAKLTLEDLTKYKADAAAGRIPPTEAQIQASLKTISDIQGIAETDWTDAVGKFDYSRFMGLQDATNAGVLIENLRDVASFNNLGMLKGPMSDKDIAFLKSVSSKLDPVQSNEQFEKNIVEMYNIAARKAGVKEITKLSEIPKVRILPGQFTQPTQNTGAGQISPQDLSELQKILNP